MGARPIDLHIEALEKLGAEFGHFEDIITCKAERQTAGEIILSQPSVGATENIMLYAVGCRGVTRIVNAAREPEINDLQDFLRLLGYRVDGAGSPVIEIEGRKKQPGIYCTYKPIPDRIAAATWLCAAAITGGEVELKGARPDHMGAVLEMLRESGSAVFLGVDSLALSAPKRPAAMKRIKTVPYPGFPTDAQPLFFALASVASGRTLIEETMFENRFRHGQELLKMGANVFMRDKFASIEGVGALAGAEVCSRDLRGGAALVLAGLAAEGRTVVKNADFIDRGYEGMEAVLSALGANIIRTD